MSKFSVSLISFLILFVIFANGFYDAYTSRKLGNIAYVLALGIDVGENAKIKISAQFTKNSSVSPGSSSSSDESSNAILVSGEADSIFSGINLLNSYIGKEINLSHCVLYIISDEFAKQGIATEIYSLINNEDVRPTANLVISTCTAYEYLENSKPNLEKLTTQYYETFAITGRFTGYFSNITIGDFYNSLCGTYNSPTAILGGLNSTARKKDSESTEDITKSEDLTAGTSSIKGKRGTENFGLAVFKDDKFCGKLTTMESVCHLLIQNRIDSCIVSINNPLNDKKTEKVELQLFPRKNSEVIITIADNIPYISINLDLHADIMTLDKDINYEENDTLLKISNATKDYLTTELYNYLKKVSSEYESDIDNFCTKATSNFLTIPEWNSFDWNKNFKNSIFDININVNVLSTMLITKT